MTGNQAGPERGVEIRLPSGGKINTSGEPNSLERKSTEEGVKAELGLYACASGRQEVKEANIGRLRGSQGTLVCGNRLIKVFLVFRPGGDPIYLLRLESVKNHEIEDEIALDGVAASFRIIPWK